MSTRFCKTLLPNPARPDKQGAFYQPSRLWPQKSTVHIGFMEGTDLQKKYVVETVRKNYGPDKINLKLVFDPVITEQTHIRVTFDSADGAWSLLGTDALSASPDSATVNLGWLDEDKDFGVIKHEFGHALMAWNHEHDSPFSNPIQWNKPVVYKALGGPPNNWDKETIDSNMFDVYNPKQEAGSTWDSKSIMEYFFPKSWTLNGIELQNNQQLSDVDKRVQRMAYPPAVADLRHSSSGHAINWAWIAVLISIAVLLIAAVIIFAMTRTKKKI